jgi:hypothetical protein
MGYKKGVMGANGFHRTTDRGSNKLEKLTFKPTITFKKLTRDQVYFYNINVSRFKMEICVYTNI